MSKTLVVSGVIGIVCLSSLVFSLSPLAAFDHEPSMMPADITEVRVQSEVVESAPPDVLARLQARSSSTDSAQLRDAYIASVGYAPQITPLEGRTIEVWSRNVDSLSHTLFNHFTVKLADGSQVEESIGGEVRPGEWLHVTYRMPVTESGIVDFDVELTELGTFFEYVHDCSRGFTNRSWP
jgi:hypothetical protein